FGSGGQAPARTGNRHSGMAEAPYNVYPAADGYIALICVNEQHFAALLEAMGRQDLADDPRLETLKSRVANIDFVDGVVSAWTSRRTREELYKKLRAHRVPCAPLRDLG